MIRREERIPYCPRAVFYDIETTGFSPKNEQIYLIGVLVPEAGGGRLIQWFAENAADEGNVLKEIGPFLMSDLPLISFNGETFDVPFIRDRAAAWGLTVFADDMKSLDLYKIIRPYKTLFCLEDLKQKTIERALSLSREDCFSGGELIQVYRDWQENRSPELLDQLFCHNRDDVAGLGSLDAIRTVPAYFRQTPKILSEVTQEKGSTRTLTLFAQVKQPALIPWQAQGSQWSVQGEGTQLLITLEVRREKLKYFFPNYRDYYYFPEEGRAIHKSIAQFSDRTVRQKATAENCCQPFEGWVFPLPGACEPTFRTSYKEKDRKIDLSDGVIKQPQRWQEMLQAFRQKYRIT